MVELLGNLQYFEHLCLATLLGALLGLEREIAGKDPSLRTFALISLGSCAFSILSLEAFFIAKEHNMIADPGRVSAQIVSGMGFLGAGAIFRTSNHVRGLTTAALMWTTAASGMAAGWGKFSLALSITLIALFVLVSLKLVHGVVRRIRPDFYRGTSDYDD